jgi:hypothetical protein
MVRSGSSKQWFRASITLCIGGPQGKAARFVPWVSGDGVKGPVRDGVKEGHFERV